MISQGSRAKIPNALTCARIVLAACFFGVLAIYQYPTGPKWALPVAIELFIVAALTDALDGYLARKWNVVSVFGRIVDPFADKVLILGAFVMLAGHQFTMAEGWSNLGVYGADPIVQLPQISGVETWMVVVILARELLVTTIRAVMEGRGIDFSASGFGKAKMIAQSVSVPVILILVMRSQPDTRDWIHATTPGDIKPSESWHALGCSIVAWVTTVITALSAVPYVHRAVVALRAGKVTKEAP